MIVFSWERGGERIKRRGGGKAGGEGGGVGGCPRTVGTGLPVLGKRRESKGGEGGREGGRENG